jgi:signal transduction histidine kinase
VADAGHELRTPLALLRTELELALRQAQTVPELREAVRWSSYEVERLSQLAEDMLLIARADGGRLPLRLEKLAVDELFASVTARFEWRAEELGKSVTWSPSHGRHIEGDRLRLEQALGNLVDNALRHGGHEISLHANAANGHLELHVSDNGTGLPSGYLAHAFERFTRGDSARGRGGAGLGLAIAKTIAESHEGTAHIANVEGSGADAWVALPALEDAPSRAALRGSPRRVGGPQRD